MLTQDQLTQLEPLIRHPKFGKILKFAIRNWKKFKPMEGNTGLQSENGKFVRNKLQKGCCLIGASLYGCKGYGLLTTCKKKFNLLNQEIVQIIDGFDGYDIQDSEAALFGKQVRNIVIKNV